MTDKIVFCYKMLDLEPNEVKVIYGECLDVDG